jgi:predicted lipid-binding transport protein (Tim44 family)
MKKEGVIILVVQGAMGQFKKLILPTKDLENLKQNVEKVKEAYGYGDFKTISTEIIEGKILN